MDVPAPENMHDDGTDEMIMEATELLDTNEVFSQPHAVDEVAVPAPNDTCKEGIHEMMMEATQLLDTD